MLVLRHLYTQITDDGGHRVHSSIIEISRERITMLTQHHVQKSSQCRAQQSDHRSCVGSRKPSPTPPDDLPRIKTTLLEHPENASKDFRCFLIKSNH